MFLLDHNPFELLLEEAVSSGIIKLPSMEDLNSILMDIVPDLLKDELVIIERLVKDVYQKIKNVVHDPSKLGETLLDMLEDILWTIFDAGEKIIIAIYDILLKFFKQFIVLCTSTIKIPLLTTAFEVLAEQDFSIVNCGTFVFAAIMNIAYAITHGKLPFEVLSPPSDFRQTIADDDLRLVKRSSSDPTPHSQIKAFVATPMVIKSTNLESRKRNVVTAAEVPETPTAPPTNQTDSEVENVEAAAHTFAMTDLWAGGFATASGVLNADIILVTMGKAIGKNSGKGNTKTDKEVSAIAMIPDIIAYSMALVSRVTDLAVYKASIAKNSALSKELGNDNTRVSCISSQNFDLGRLMSIADVRLRSGISDHSRISGHQHRQPQIRRSRCQVWRRCYSHRRRYDIPTIHQHLACQRHRQVFSRYGVDQNDAC